MSWGPTKPSPFYNKISVCFLIDNFTKLELKPGEFWTPFPEFGTRVAMIILYLDIYLPVLSCFCLLYFIPILLFLFEFSILFHQYTLFVLSFLFFFVWFLLSSLSIFSWQAIYKGSKRFKGNSERNFIFPLILKFLFHFRSGRGVCMWYNVLVL